MMVKTEFSVLYFLLRQKKKLAGSQHCFSDKYIISIILIGEKMF